MIAPRCWRDSSAEACLYMLHTQVKNHTTELGQESKRTLNEALRRYFCNSANVNIYPASLRCACLLASLNSEGYFLDNLFMCIFHQKSDAVEYYILQLMSYILQIMSYILQYINYILQSILQNMSYMKLHLTVNVLHFSVYVLHLTIILLLHLIILVLQFKSYILHYIF